MKVITTASYYGSGSSAVTDFISEFDGVKSLTSNEFRFAHDPDGLSELEYNLVENFNRHNSGHALKRYKKLVDYNSKHLISKRYEPFFDNRWKELSYKYIEELTDFSYPGFWQYDFYDKGAIYEFISKFPERVMHATIWRNKPDKHLFFNKITTLASNPGEERFLKITRKYTTELLKAANKENKPILMVDQILPSSNIERHMRYFDNMKAFVVDRDPRDQYLLAKYEWNDSGVPHDVETFCKWFKYVRATKNKELYDEDKVMFIQFEDLVYNYEETTKKIMKWINLSEKNHIRIKEYFNPDISIKNTRYWESHPQYKKEAEEIAKKLPEFLYTIKEK